LQYARHLGLASLDDAPINGAERAAIRIVTFIDELIPPEVGLSDGRRVLVP
jgi:hypothetical protein